MNFQKERTDPEYFLFIDKCLIANDNLKSENILKLGKLVKKLIINQRLSHKMSK